MIQLLALAALAAPPSSRLTGPEGTLAWEVRPTAAGIHVTGTSPKWTVEHDARADLTPVRTAHHDAVNGDVTVTFTATGATVTKQGQTWTLSQAGLWDGDTLDIRLGAEVAAGRTDLAFSVVDPTEGKIYSLDSAKVAAETCGARACTHVRVQLTGLYRLVGPTWHYWYGADGQLLRFEGPAGKFAVP